MPRELNIDKSKTAVVVIDLQKGIAAMPTEPYPSKSVIENAVKIVDAARKNEMHVFLVHVSPSPDMKDMLRPVSETSFPARKFDADWSAFVPQLYVQPTDILIIKHQWGAFYGTELDLQLRRRGINTIILCGISTNIGVESTARNAYELGFNQIFAEDAMSARSKEEHEYPFKYIFPRLGLIRKTEGILEGLS